ncbi:bifunctional ADP-dependent NAD(P)H-hydrate dehydratase/NAD(P)H-hydrate epimerase [Arthrobacter sp. AQ5-05]|uniref:NAD(P)H-hydrate dehydratase n=1 Tax=Arthrobacter sp. AQ5-05 TaxID=2184581 RepID=UPI000DCBD0EE|nr:NAD(P)H-hydrate dehydratase [Arthrobacter sp. AQ5-05]RAX49729.1 bifunctional ADP-dependent NAD(P)H-hydrate dehydratase/NAD(P)H-hydrate epimerase [Arthrobacter sp. AQ5-05]
MIPVYAGSRVRDAEKPLLRDSSDLKLMRRAADALAHQAVLMLKEHTGRLYGSRVVALVGPGNNGGDGLFALAALARRGVAVTAVLLASHAHQEGLAALVRAGGRTGATKALDELLEECDLLIDAAYGTGLRPGVRLPAIPRHIPVLACDVPSGVDADTGAAADSVIPAERTVTFGALKTGLVVGSGHLVSGRIRVTDLGLNPTLGEPEAWVVQGEDLGLLLDRDLGWSATGRHKYQRGVLGLLAGSARYPGAAVLSARAAVATGLGLLRTIVPENVAAALTSQVPEAVPLGTDELTALLAHNRRNGREGATRIGAWAIGPGLEDTPETRRHLQQILAANNPCVIDAGALAMLEPGGHSQLRILTPHAGELNALLAKAGVRVSARDIAADPIRWARWAAVAYDCVVLLKGSATICTAPDGYALIVHASTPDLATAGSGDVLTGILGTLLAAANFPATPATGDATALTHRLTDLAAAGALIHAHAGALAAREGTVSAVDLLVELPRAARDLGL